MMGDDILPLPHTQADAGRRVGGFLLDLVVVVVIYLFAAFVFGVLVELFAAREPTNRTYGMAEEDRVSTLIAYACYVVIPVYLVVAWGWFGRTLGQAAVGIHIVSRSWPRLGGLGFGGAVARTIGYAICWCIPFGIGFFLGWHDKISGTQAIILQNPATYQPPLPPQSTWSRPVAPFASLPPPSASTGASQGASFCSQCGMAATSDARFCKGCGARLVE